MVDAQSHDDRRLLRSGALLAHARSLGDVVAALRVTAREIAGSDGIAVVLRDGVRCYCVEEDAIEVLWKGQCFPLEACVSGWAMLNDEPGHRSPGAHPGRGDARDGCRLTAGLRQPASACRF
jgi:L-methionine (R)-S-oxide reductase